MKRRSVFMAMVGGVAGMFGLNAAQSAGTHGKRRIQLRKVESPPVGMTEHLAITPPVWKCDKHGDIGQTTLQLCFPPVTKTYCLLCIMNVLDRQDDIARHEATEETP